MSIEISDPNHTVTVPIPGEAPTTHVRIISFQMGRPPAPEFGEITVTVGYVFCDESGPSPVIVKQEDITVRGTEAINFLSQEVKDNLCKDIDQAALDGLRSLGKLPAGNVIEDVE